jgi:hypothetical protein
LPQEASPDALVIVGRTGSRSVEDVREGIALARRFGVRMPLFLDVDDGHDPAALAEFDELTAPWRRRLRETPRGQFLIDPAAAQATHLAELAAVDGVTAATAALAATLRDAVRPGTPIAVVPNAIAPAAYELAAARPRRLPGTQGRTTIGVAGTLRAGREYVSTGLAHAWTRIAARHPGVGFVTIGHAPPELVAAVPAARLVSVPFQDFDRYVEALVSIDIGCCPLSDTPFNRGKSPQKAWEHVLTAAAVVASPTVYGDDPGYLEHGGLLAEGADAWEAALSALIEDGPARRRRVNQLRGWILREHSIETQAHRWPMAWAELLLDHTTRERGTPA